ncbi:MULTISPECIES: polysaccharide pyruvyl transferase family protein [unclassified Arthrobacter]|uniref:polysaccharide pyruvyl transferase family protein n=1 Tax=unclassified Arthrobacter TaxID=235627 RepID=UPI0027D8675B|nr:MULTISPECIES: polysaccharide pyruvyl transferase family protein [unclassified Arthrobacter]
MVVTTYPAQGSRNIGDYLITQSLISMIEATVGEEAHVDVIWRAAPWEEISEVILSADHVFFACLAIRPEMESGVYPFARKVIESSVRYSIHAAGTDLRVKDNMDLLETMDEASVIFLRELALGSRIFTTRGVLTQAFCRLSGITAARFSGDIAFYAPEMYGIGFRAPTAIRNIVVSDPHRATKYIDSFVCLIAGLRSLFPQASIKVALHGQNQEIEAACTGLDLDTTSIYENPGGGLSIYDSCDLHVGYRVHGHVSALKRRKVSYLLEQDGRGADYGLTLSRKISVPNYLQFVRDDGEKRRWTTRASVSPPQQLLSMIEQDSINNFERFEGFDQELETISRRALEAVSAAIYIDPTLQQ